jgi:hypothetical protein
MTALAMSADEAGAALAARLAERAANDEPLLIGIHFGLDADRYHQDRALGSSDMKELARDPVGWWYYSKLNPRRPEDRDTPALRFGRAVHKMTLEGREAFDAAYAPTDFPGNIKAGIEERRRITDAGKIALAREEWERALECGTHVRANPELAQAFEGGASEVSVVWERDGIRRKARFDYLKIRSVVDLKSAREQDEHEFDIFCSREIAKRRYYVQLAHYWEAREQIARLVAAGAMYGHGDYVPHEWLLKVAAQREFFWTWVFFQSTGAPETFGTYAQKSNKLYEQGRSQIALAEHNWRAFSEEFGADGMPWVRRRPLQEYNCDEQPEWVWR